MDPAMSPSASSPTSTGTLGATLDGQDRGPRPVERQSVRGLPDPGERVPPLAWPTAGLYVVTLTLFAAEAYGILAGGWTPWATV
ncbi:MAG: hypothetical protein ABWX92_14715, partial [Mycetocola sp.]